jgi:hypothetical protein
LMLPTPTTNPLYSPFYLCSLKFDGKGDRE